MVARKVAYFLICLVSHVLASMAQLAERSAVNRQVLGSIPSGGVFHFFSPFYGVEVAAGCNRPPVIEDFACSARGAMDSASDFESGGCGFESRRA